ncbi:MAG TPA: 3-deoxy-8-phosphooctulonate synthase [Longimicrobiales bacterium]|nr:3-deoxy-8-phosphooctulonate synthase [Longimicrobiales bacterium]
MADTARQEAVPALFRPDGEFFVIAGPCVLEDDGLNLRVGEALAELADALRIPVIFKASFDKANRSRGTSPRGPGLDDGLARLQRVRSTTGLPVLTDIHEPDQAAAAAGTCDVLQIPAFLCRQTDLLEAAGATGRPVNVKKGQWMAPEEMAGAVRKVRDARPGAADAGTVDGAGFGDGGGAAGGVAVTERGTFFGYGDLVVDMRGFQRIRTATGAPAIFDGTHSVQRPGLGGGVSGGDPEFIGPLVRAATAAGADALFMEVHPAPSEAPSDATNMLRLDAFRPLLEEVLAVRAALSGKGGEHG